MLVFDIGWLNFFLNLQQPFLSSGYKHVLRKCQYLEQQKTTVNPSVAPVLLVMTNDKHCSRFYVTSAVSKWMIDSLLIYLLRNLKLTIDSLLLYLLHNLKST